MRYVALALTATTAVAAAADLHVMECVAEKPRVTNSWWSYRIIDGRPCWYPGKYVRPKQELYWSARASPSATPVSVEQPRGEQPSKQGPPASLAVDSTPSPRAGAFDVKWNDLLSDMALPFWRWRQPLSSQRQWSD